MRSGTPAKVKVTKNAHQTRRRTAKLPTHDGNARALVAEGAICRHRIRTVLYLHTTCSSTLLKKRQDRPKPTKTNAGWLGPKCPPKRRLCRIEGIYFLAGKPDSNRSLRPFKHTQALNTPHCTFSNSSTAQPPCPHLGGQYAHSTCMPRKQYSTQLKACSFELRRWRLKV